jgi:hypothetical protein
VTLTGGACEGCDKHTSGFALALRHSESHAAVGKLQQLVHSRVVEMIFTEMEFAFIPFCYCKIFRINRKQHILMLKEQRKLTIQNEKELYIKNLQTSSIANNPMKI